VVVLRLLPSRRQLRFRGTPLDRHNRFTVSIVLPPSAASETWKPSVRADGRVYRARSTASRHGHTTAAS
jgi:hypothetical protein